MARNLDPSCRQCRREGEKLFLKAEKCFTDKCAIERRNYVIDRLLENGWIKQADADAARKSPLAVTGSKVMINYARDHTIKDALDYIAAKLPQVDPSRIIAVASKRPSWSSQKDRSVPSAMTDSVTLRGGAVESHGDHRIAMAFAVAAQCARLWPANASTTRRLRRRCSPGCRACSRWGTRMPKLSPTRG